METIEELKRMSNVEPRGLISASVNFSEGRMEEQGELDHYLGAATTENGPDHLAKLEVPASTWAVFESVGPYPSALQNVWGRIYSEWFPSSSYELAPGPEMLWNEGKDTSSPTSRSEIWRPVKLRYAGSSSICSTRTASHLLAGGRSRLFLVIPESIIARGQSRFSGKD
jgi:AraC family transcriptional regulator